MRSSCGTLDLSSDERTVLATAGHSLVQELERMMQRVNETSVRAAPGYLVRRGARGRSHRRQGRTAELLYVHRNTVGNRVQRAKHLLGVTLEDSRPELYAALAILEAVTPLR
jgi:sugar diacid utilization regulator